MAGVIDKGRIEIKLGEYGVAPATVLADLAILPRVQDYRRLRTEISCRPANTDERDYLQLERSANVLVVDSLNVDCEGVAIQASHTRFAAGRVQLVIETVEPAPIVAGSPVSSAVEP